MFVLHYLLTQGWRLPCVEHLLNYNYYYKDSDVRSCHQNFGFVEDDDSCFVFFGDNLVAENHRVGLVDYDLVGYGLVDYGLVDYGLVDYGLVDYCHNSGSVQGEECHESEAHQTNDSDVFGCTNSGCFDFGRGVSHQYCFGMSFVDLMSRHILYLCPENATAVHDRFYDCNYFLLETEK